MLQSTDEVLPLVKGIIWVSKTRLGLSFLLALLSWVVLTVCWNLTHEGSPAFKFIAALIRPGWNSGHYVAALLFANNPQHRAAAALMGEGGVLVMYTAFWYAVVVAIRRMRSNKRSGTDERLSRPEP